MRGAKWSLAPSTGGPMNAAMPARAGAAVWGPEHHDRVRERFGHCLSWGIFGEDLPDERNRVTLDPELVDAAGVPAPRVDVRGVGELAPAARLPRRARARVAARGGRHERRHPDPDAQRRLAPARHGAHGRRPGDLGRRPLGQGARRRQPLRRRRQRLRDRGRREPDQHDLRRWPCASPTAWSSGAPSSGCRRERSDDALRARLARLADGLIPARERHAGAEQPRHRRPPARRRARVAPRPRRRPAARARGRRGRRRPDRLGRAAARPTIPRPTTRS